jgi:hypothetical protein
MLEESISARSEVSNWEFRQSDLPVGEIIPPDFISARSTASEGQEVETLRMELENELGDLVLAELYRNIQNENRPRCKRFVEAFEAKNLKAVQKVRTLIFLEEPID